jgi:hypothetical protein
VAAVATLLDTHVSGKSVAKMQRGCSAADGALVGSSKHLTSLDATCAGSV